MRQLTDAEKQQLAGKIKDEQERQQGLRETNPDLPESFEKASAKQGFYKKPCQVLSENTVCSDLSSACLF